MATRKKSPIIEFRSALAKLKKANLLPYNIKDIRQAEPTPGLTKAIKKYADIVRGTATALPKSHLAITNSEARSRKLKVVKPANKGGARVIVTHFPDEKVTAEHRGINYHSAEGIRRLELPRVRTDTVGHYLDDLKKRTGKDLPDIRPGTKFAARYFNGRTQVFESLRDLLNTIHAYDTTVSANTRKHTNEVIRNIELFEITDASIPEYRRQKTEAKKKVALAREKARVRKPVKRRSRSKYNPFAK